MNIDPAEAVMCMTLSLNALALVLLAFAMIHLAGVISRGGVPKEPRRYRRARREAQKRSNAQREAAGRAGTVDVE